jgi:hypothetical protein
MNAKANRSNLGAVTRRLIVLLALVVGLSLAFTGAASAQTVVPFQATVDNISTHGGGNSGPTCSTYTWYYCGTATIAGYGPALWWFDSPGPPLGTPVSSDCSRYTGTSTFQLSDGDRLVLNEYNVELCHPGNSGNTPNFWGNTQGVITQGHPNRGVLTTSWWTVCNALTTNSTTGCGSPISSPQDPNNGQLRYTTGEQFKGLTGGNGTNDSFQTNGAILTAAWSGTLTFQ